MYPFFAARFILSESLLPFELFATLYAGGVNAGRWLAGSFIATASKDAACAMAFCAPVVGFTILQIWAFRALQKVASAAARDANRRRRYLLVEAAAAAAAKSSMKRGSQIDARRKWQHQLCSNRDVPSR